MHTGTLHLPIKNVQSSDSNRKANTYGHGCVLGGAIDFEARGVHFGSCGCGVVGGSGDELVMHEDKVSLVGLVGELV